MDNEWIEVSYKKKKEVKNADKHKHAIKKKASVDNEMNEHCMPEPLHYKCKNYDYNSI